MELTTVKITVCGGGNGAQTLAPVAACNLGCTVDLYDPFGDEAARLRAGLANRDGLEMTGAVQAGARVPQTYGLDSLEWLLAFASETELHDGASVSH